MKPNEVKDKKTLNVYIKKLIDTVTKREEN